jgi:hypothetical protein
MKTTKCLFFMVCFCAGVLAEAQVKLSFNPAEGEKYSYLQRMEMTSKQRVMEQELSMSLVFDMFYEMNVKDRGKDVTSLEFVYNRVVMSLSTPAKVFNYDSGKVAENPSEIDRVFGGMLGALVGRVFGVDFAPDGSVKSMSGYDAIVKDMLGAVPEHPAFQQVGEMLMKSFNADALKSTFEQSFKMYPDREVNVGDSWSTAITFAPFVMDSKIDNVYVLKSVAGDTAAVSMTGVFAFDVKSMANFAEGSKLSGEYEGEIVLDIRTGMPVRAVVTQDMKGKLLSSGVEMGIDTVSKMVLSRQK